MCFLEFIGYTCGHTSLPVLRPCPLTTASHTFPVCPRRADKPFLAGEMCSACQKIIHSRATQIEEYEHRFMHERGVCGCETIFPYLIRPRIIGGGGGGPQGGDGYFSIDDGYGQEARVDNGILNTDPNQLPPILHESTDVSGHAVVSVRLPSLYAAEWIVDHRARHEAGLCCCRVDFRTYQQVMQEEEEAELVSQTVETAEGGDEKTNNEEDDNRLSRWERDRSRDTRRTASTSLPFLCRQQSGSRSVSLEHSHSHEEFTYFFKRDISNSPLGVGDRSGSGTSENHTGQATSPAFHLSGDASVFSPASGQSSALEMAIVYTAREDLAPPPATSTTITLPTMHEDEVYGDYHPSPDSSAPCLSGTAMRYSGAVFAEVPAYLPLTGPFLARPSPYVSQSGQQSMPVMDGLIIQPEDCKQKDRDEPNRHQVFSEAASPTPTLSSSKRKTRWYNGRIRSGRDPLVGFPIGAGPEGVLHAAPWQSRTPCWRKSWHRNPKQNNG